LYPPGNHKRRAEEKAEVVMARKVVMAREVVMASALGLVEMLLLITL
jgi:hypothetical protein